ncbi:MAG: DNA-3-methyladenine glycosylase [Prevotellaceae bacterium]|jgi:DNA-3-methyladenine glycosylase|nr:DNA-3-methyladenine glycosylase [Prevotellaceae bacterium]
MEQSTVRDKILGYDFFRRDVLIVAPDLLGKYLVRSDGSNIQRCKIVDTEAYRGAEDKACHARVGRTTRTEAMFLPGGVSYIYFIYGTHYMFNVVTGQEDEPQAVLIRGLDVVSGPGRITRLLNIDNSFYGEDLTLSNRLWIEDGAAPAPEKVIRTHRVGINYAGEWKNKPWRFMIKPTF